MRGSEYVSLALARRIWARPDGPLSALLIDRDAIRLRPACGHRTTALEHG
jgi:hypothetical protein